MGLACSRKGSSSSAMSKSPSKASTSRLTDSRSENLEPWTPTGSYATVRKPSHVWEPRNLVERVINDGEANNRILDLPVHIILDIFSRLQLKQVFLCRCTCKTFLHLLSSPNNALLRLDKAQPCLLLREYTRKHLHNFFDQKAYVADLADDTPKTNFFYSKAHLIDLEEAESCTSSSNPSALIKHEIYSLPAGKLDLVGSCNGLVCLYQLKTDQYYVCNPLLGEWTILPLLINRSTTTDNASSSPVSFFGYCPKLKQYKIIRFISSSSDVEILTVGTPRWRYIGEGPMPKARGSFNPSAVGDILFTIEYTGENGTDIIWSFNLETERFQVISSPAHFRPEYLLKVSWINVGRIANFLCICYIFNESVLELWTTQSYNTTDPSWTRISSNSFRYWHLLFRMDQHHPAVFLHKNYDIWMKHEGTHNLYKFSPQTDEMRAFKVTGAGSGFEIVSHVPSFIPLREALAPYSEDLEVYHYGYKLLSP